MTLVFKNFLLILAFLSLLVVSGMGTALAACTPGIPCTTYDISSTDNSWKGGQTCDGNYMNQMYGEAFLHAQREISMNAQIIRKPDSILEYTCFDKFVVLSSARAGQIFTETAYWENRPFTFKTADEVVTDNPPPGWVFKRYLDNHLDIPMNLLIANTLGNYISNFSHKFLGGASAIDYAMGGGGGFNCTNMSAIWDLSRCVNFGEDDNFLSFGQLVSGDPRQLPAACAGKPGPVLNAGAPSTFADIPLAAIYISNILEPAGVMTISESDPCPAVAAGSPINNSMIRLSNNCDVAYSAVELAKGYFEYTRDPYFVIDNPTAIFSSVPTPVVVWGIPRICGRPIPTGVKIPYYYHIKVPDPLSGMDTILDPAAALATLGIGGLDYEEHVCPNPSCSYIPGLSECVPSVL